MPARRPRTTDSDAVLAATLDDALERVHELSMRLWAVRETHRPVRPWLRRTQRCATCARPYPCATVRATGPAAAPHHGRDRATAA